MTLTPCKVGSLPGEDPTPLRILIVEDHVDYAESTAMFLRLHGHDVEIARDGTSALKMARIVKPDVVLLDLALPDMSGYDVARQLTNPRPQFTPMIIAISGYIHENSRRNTEDTGIDFHMVKPIDPDELQTILARFQNLLVNSMPA